MQVLILKAGEWAEVTGRVAVVRAQGDSVVLAFADVWETTQELQQEAAQLAAKLDKQASLAAQ